MQKLREVMRPGFLVAVPKDATVTDAVREMCTHNVGIVAVLEGDRLEGLFSERDVVRRVIGAGLDPTATAVGDVMTHDIVVADPEEDHQSAMKKMDQANIRHLPVVSDGSLVSMLSIRDLMRVELQHRGEEIRYLHEYMFQVPSGATSSG